MSNSKRPSTVILKIELFAFIVIIISSLFVEGNILCHCKHILGMAFNNKYKFNKHV